MSQGIWTITYQGVEQSAAAWGLTARPVIKTRDRSPSEISFRMAGADPAGAIPFPFQSQVVIKQNRTFAGGAWSGAGYVFTGYQTTQPGDTSGSGQGVTLTFKDALWLMQNTTFQQLWAQASTPGAPFYTSRCVLFMNISGWVPNLFQSVQWQLQQIVAYAQLCGISIAPGDIDYSGWFLNYYHCRAVSIWDAILKCLEPIPDAKVWVDGSQNPPTLNVKTRANLAAKPTPAGTGPGPISLPYKGVDAAGRLHHSSKGFTPRYDLIPPAVILQYQFNSTINNKTLLSWTSDIYPPGASAQTPFALIAPIDLVGFTQVIESGWMDTEPLQLASFQTGFSNGSSADHAIKRAWWGSKRGGSHHKLVNDNGTTNWKIRFQDSYLNFTPIGDATVTDEQGNPVNLALFPNRHIKGPHHRWMSYNGVPVQMVRAKVHVQVAISEYDVNAATPAETDSNGNRLRVASIEHMSCDVTLTNAAPGLNQYTNSQYTSTSEVPVQNLAQNIFSSRATLDYDGTHEIVDPGLPNAKPPTNPLTQIIGHWNVLNLTGPAANPAWANANMTIAGTEIDLVTNHIRIEIGPSKHLQPQDWSSMLQFFRYRRIYQPSSVRATGQADASNSVEMAQYTPDGNTVPRESVQPSQAYLSLDATAAGVTNLVTLDATVGQFTRAQIFAGATITTGIIPPIYTGAGAPATGTLIANAYYRVADLYVDTTGNVLYRCKTAGTNSTSVWVSLGGVSLGTYTLATGVDCDKGDYLVCAPTGGGSNVNIAKPPKLRVSLASEAYIDGTGTHTYAYSAVLVGGLKVAYQRTNTWGSGAQTELVTPAYLVGDTIYAMNCPSLNMPITPGSGTTVAVSLIDIHDKDWSSQ